MWVTILNRTIHKNRYVYCQIWRYRAEMETLQVWRRRTIDQWWRVLHLQSVKHQYWKIQVRRCKEGCLFCIFGLSKRITFIVELPRAWQDWWILQVKPATNNQIYYSSISIRIARTFSSQISWEWEPMQWLQFCFGYLTAS